MSLFTYPPAATISPPVGASTAANQVLEIADLDAIKTSAASLDTKTPVLGQALAPASVPVVLTAAQILALTPPPAITNFANETGGNLAAIKLDTDKIPSQGQALAAASFPVVLTALQITALTPPPAITGFALDSTLAAQSAKLPATLGQKAMAASMAVTLASDQASIPVAATLSAETTKVIGTVNTKGKPLTSQFNELLTLSTVQTFTAPANAVGAIIQAQDNNATNIRIKQGGTATTTSGIQMQAGRSENLTNGSDISVCSESGTNAICVIWSIQA